ncbi:hypothetical protein D018_1419B, partial [Vibrio parahaemolyticus VP2007-007]
MSRQPSVFFLKVGFASAQDLKCNQLH